MFVSKFSCLHAIMSRNARSNKNGRFDTILSNHVNVHGFEDFGKFCFVNILAISQVVGGV